MKIALACDHGAYEYKEILKKELPLKGYEVIDYGTYSTDSCDYVDFASKAAKAVAKGECDRGIVICGTGIGVSITANKIKGIRCALCSEPFSARLTREHNDSNVLAMGQRVIGEEIMREIVHVWLTTPFSNGERHLNRINKIAKLESEEN
ncbi:MAG: ribose 5-phosphate isomerase B [Erysipelotrichaceae bacterium]